MKKIKNMTQVEYDNYISLELLPDLKDEYGNVDVVVLKDSSIYFARICERCGDIIPIGSTYNIYDELMKVDSDSKIRYFELLTDLDVLNGNQVLECECYEDEDDENSDEAYEYKEEDDNNDDTYLDLDEDYGDGNYEY